MVAAMPVRPIRAEDRDGVALHRGALWTHTTPEENRDELAAILAGRPHSTMPLMVLVAEAPDGALEGFIEVGLRSHADGCDPTRPVGFVEGWYVRPESRGRGVGAELMRAAERWARDQGCRELASDTWIDNEGSVRAHRSLGFEVVDRCVNFRKQL
jgi:aminoglycoside 6'-N-acetyltransferase I